MCTCSNGWLNGTNMSAVHSRRACTKSTEVMLFCVKGKSASSQASRVQFQPAESNLQGYIVHNYRFPMSCKNCRVQRLSEVWLTRSFTTPSFIFCHE